VIAGSRIRSILNVTEYAPDLPNAVATAERHGIPIHVVASVNSEEAEQLLRRLDVQLAVSLGNGMIRPSLYSIPAHGTINVHHGAVPEYRGGPPTFWEIHDGRDEVGYTIHKLDRHIDTGDVLASGSVPLQYRATLKETMRNTMRELYRRSAAALVEVVVDIENLERRARKQDRPGFNTTPSLWQFLAAARRCGRRARAQSR
jgi:methionyl-tRNA formyltransferase